MRNTTSPEYVQHILTLYPKLLIIWIRLNGYPTQLYRTQALRLVAIHKGYPVKKVD